MMKKRIAIIVAIIFCILVGEYAVDFNRFHTKRLMCPMASVVATDNMLSSLNVTAIAEDSKGLMWIGTSAGINVFDGHSYTQFSHDTQDSTALPDDYITCLHRDCMGRMWVGTQNGVAMYDGGGRFRRCKLPVTNNCTITDIADANSGNGVVVAVGNLQRSYFHVKDGKVEAASLSDIVPKQKVVIPDAPYSLRKPLQMVSCSFADSRGNVWVGFRNAGYQIVSASMTAYKRANENILASATKGKDIIALGRVGETLLAGTTLRLYAFETKTGALNETLYQSMFRQSENALAELNNIVALDNRRAWIVGSREVLSCEVNDGRVGIKGRTLGDNGGGVQLGNGVNIGGKLYVSSDAGAILCMAYASNRVEHIPVKSQWYDDETQLAALRDGSLLVFMRNMHIATYKPTERKVKELSVTGEKAGGNIDPAFAYEDSYGKVWLGTKRSGLYRLDMRKMSVERMNLLNDVHVQGIVEDSRRNIWITTLKDVVCYNPKTEEMQFSSVVSSGQNDLRRQFFDNSVCLSPDSSIVLGNSDGCCFLPLAAQNAARCGLENKLCIYSVKVVAEDGKAMMLNDSVADGKCYTFSHDENSVGFSFFYPNFGQSSSFMYQYRLEGYDSQWHEPTYTQNVNYANLPPGKYMFRLRLVASSKGEPLCERYVVVNIKPAWWASSAAWTFYVVCVMALIYYVNTLYLRLRSNHLRLLNERHERERERHTNEMNMSFFANVSHEFRNPITLIAGPLIALRADDSLTKTARQSLDRVCLSVNRMLRLIDQMLDFNQLETDALRLRVTNIDAATELNRLIASFEESAQVRGIVLDVRRTAANYEMYLDTDKFEKIMSNLFTNALKHTPDNGRIAITMNTRNTAYEGEWLDVEVFNSGSHIAGERIKDVFKRYFQLSDANASHKYGWGTGIGLYYVKRLVGLHHGEITVRNQCDETDAKNDGVAFCFSLPMGRIAYDGDEICVESPRIMQIPISAPVLIDNSQQTNNRQKILIVDDDVDVAQYIRSLFVADYIVENRYSAETALKDMADIRPDIILSDIVMGEMSGYDFCRTLKANLMWSHIPVVLVTAKSNIDEQISGLRLGAIAYITKPFDPTYLRTLVESQLRNVNELRQKLSNSVNTDEAADVADTLSDNDRRFMDELYSIMEKRLTELDLNVAVVSHDMLMSQSKFNYKLKQLTGDTPGVFFRKYKLNRAARLLREGRMNVSEVAMMTGFNTAAHFSVAFKKQFGVVPSEFR